MYSKNKYIGVLSYGCYDPLTRHFEEYYFQIYRQIVDIEMGEIIHISTQFLKGEKETIKQQFDFTKITHNKHRVFCLNFSNLDYFVKNILPKFSIIISVEPHWPFVLYINKYAKLYNTKIIFIQHGTLEGRNKHSTELIQSRFLALFKHKRVMYNYIAFLHNILYFLRRDIKIVKFVLKSILNRSLGLSFPIKEVDSNYLYDELYLLSEDDKNRFLNLTSYKVNQIIILESPDFINYKKYKGIKYKSDNKYVIYIDDYSIELHNLYDQFNKFVNYVILKGYDFVFIPRHREDEQLNRDLLDQRIIFAEKKSIYKYIDNADYVFGHVSSLLLLPLRLNKLVYSLVSKKLMEDLSSLHNIEKFKSYSNFYIINLDELDEKDVEL